MKKRQLFQLWAKYKWLLASPIFGTALTIITFIATELDAIFSISILLVFILIPSLWIIINEFKIRTRQARALSDSIRNFSFVGTILNTDGDFHSNSRTTVNNQSGKKIEYFEPNFIQTQGKSIKISKPETVSCLPQNNKLIERYTVKFKLKQIIDDKEREYLNCDYAYKLSKPLNKINDFITYDVNLEIKKHCKDAFNSKGDIDGVYVKAICDIIEKSMKAPPNYRFIISDFWIQDNQGEKKENLKGALGKDIPILRSNETELYWKVTFPKVNHFYLFNYKLERN